jgi:hypothetical protein
MSGAAVDKQSSGPYDAGVPLRGDRIAVTSRETRMNRIFTTDRSLGRWFAGGFGVGLRLGDVPAGVLARSLPARRET